MSCKHEGGTDACERYKSKHCVAWMRLSNAKHGADRGRTGSLPRKRSSMAGAAAEDLVAAELIFRGLEVWAPRDPGSLHDLAIHLDSGEWRTVQVKSGEVHKRTGTIYLNTGKSAIRSDFLFVVDPGGRRIRFIPLSAGRPDYLLPEGALVA
jgi:hypothetical protein